MSNHWGKRHSSSWVVLHFSNHEANCHPNNRGKCSLLKNMYKLRCAVEIVVKTDGIGSELSLGLPWRGEYCCRVKGTFIRSRWVCRRTTIRVLRFRRISTMLNIGNFGLLDVTKVWNACKRSFWNFGRWPLRIVEVFYRGLPFCMALRVGTPGMPRKQHGKGKAGAPLPFEGAFCGDCAFDPSPSR